MTRPSRTEPSRYLMQLSASLILDMDTNPNPRDSRVQGSITRRTSSTLNKTFSHYDHMIP
ncbi:hypothetical protein HanIR_Chr08g0389971 [Helianthus annuus]|nr:hypothetical protein HanIR_Chr08g0389971 [Helianthus annuus]